MAKLCMLDPLFYPYQGGTEKHVLEVSKRLVKDYQQDITVLTSSLPGTLAHAEMDGIKIIRTPSLYLDLLPPFLPPPYTISPFHALEVMGQDAQIFHIHNRYWYHAATLGAIKLRKKKLVLTLHNAKPEGISFATDKLGAIYDLFWGQWIMEMSDRIIAVSEWTKRKTVPKRLQDRCTVIHNGIDVERFSPKVDGSVIRKKLGIGKAPLLLSNGRLVTQKGFYYLIEAFAKLKKDLPLAKLVIIGKGPLQHALDSQIKQLGLSGSVNFVTGIPETEMPLYYAAADLFILPTLWEPCAVALLEAMASGKPIVTTNAGGNPELVTNGCGVLTSPRDGQALYEAAVKLLFDKNRLEKMGDASRKRAVNYFTWDITARKTDAVYKNI